MELLEKIKTCLRFDTDDLDDDLQDVIEAAKKDLKISGVVKIDIEDPLIVRAIKIYCKAEYEEEINISKQFKNSYEALKNHLALCSEYNSEENI